MTPLSELIEWVKAATGPDRHIDGLLSLAFPPEGEERTPLGDATRLYGKFWFKTRFGEGSSNSPEYTASIDAALALVERLLGVESDGLLYNYDLGWHASAHAEMAYTADFHVAVGTPPDMRAYHGQAHSLPLAILTALLLALSQDQK